MNSERIQPWIAATLIAAILVYVFALSPRVEPDQRSPASVVAAVSRTANGPRKGTQAQAGSQA